MPRRYVLVCFLDPWPDGYEFSAANWPPHLTLVPNFSIDLGASGLAVRIQSALNGQGRVSVPTQDEERFGPRKTVPVSVLEPARSLLAMHEHLLDTLSDGGAHFDQAEYVGPGYRPHVTITPERRLEHGEVVVVDSVSMVDLEPDGDPRSRMVLKTLNLTGP